MTFGYLMVNKVELILLVKREVYSIYVGTKT